MTLFEQKAPGVMQMLMDDFDLSAESAAAILGNIGHECNGFETLQEIRPTVPGSRGGYGWCQWTGPRRLQFEAYCARNGLDPASDAANYKWLFVELTGAEKKAIPAVQAAQGLDAKVIAFERAFLRAGVKNYASREKWAETALAAFRTAKPAPGGTKTPGAPRKGSTALQNGGAAAILALIAALAYALIKKFG